VGQILYPIYTPQPEVSIPALRAGVINGLHNSGDGLTAVDFLKAYPNEVLAVNLPALFSVIDKPNPFQVWCSSSPIHPWTA
jgi:hypothetical protein